MAQGARLPRQRRRRAADDGGRGRRPLPVLGAAPRPARLRDRRRRGQGRRRRAAAPPRRRGARSALGDRLEVPAHDGDHAVEGRAVERRQVRRHAPVRRARARPRRRRHGQAGDAAQRGGHRPQGPAPGRGRHRAARRRRHPAGALARAARRREQEAPADPAAARALPVLRHRDGQGRGRGLHQVPQPRLPRAPLAAAQALRLARGDGHRRAGGEAGRPAPAGGPGQDPRRLLPPRRRPAHRARGLGADQRRAHGGQHRRLQGPRLRARALRDRPGGGRLRHRAQPRPAVPHHRRAARGHARADRGHAGRRAQDGREDRRAARRREDARRSSAIFARRAS